MPTGQAFCSDGVRIAYDVVSAYMRSSGAVRRMPAYTTDIDVRFRDIDPLAHVSHTVYVVYLQQTRLEFSFEELEMAETGYDQVVVHLEVDYHDDIALDADVVAKATVTEIGESSFTMEYAVTADGDVAATGESVQVVIDVETGDPCPVPEEWRSTLERYREG